MKCTGRVVEGSTCRATKCRSAARASQVHRFGLVPTQRMLAAKLYISNYTNPHILSFKH